MLATREYLTPAIKIDQSPARVLLVTGTTPGEPGVGGVILRDMLQTIGPENCHCCWLASKHGPQRPFIQELPTTIHIRRYEHAYRPVSGFVGDVVSAAAMRLFRPREVALAAKAVTNVIRSFRPDFVLAVLESAASIQTALRVHKMTGIPIRSIVWDDVDLVCRQGGFDRWTRSWIETSFAQILQASERVAVICENMQTAYKLRYGSESFVLRLGVANSRNALKTNPARDHFLIGFAGTVNSPDCLKALIAALDEVEWKLNGRDVALRLLGMRYVLDSKRPQRIEFFGWRSVEETLQRLEECDVQYLPQSFAPVSKIFSELSFPTKLSTYVAANRPILLHAPSYGSVAGFWQQHPLGAWCDSLSSAQILQSLREMQQADDRQLSEWTASIRTVQRDVLSTDRFAAGVRRLIGP